MKEKYIKCLIFYGSIGLALGALIWHTGKMMVVREQMELYLKTKYGKDFVVSKIRYVYPYLGGSLEIEGLAYPKDDPGLRFDIGRSASDNDPKTQTFGETYISDLWAKQKREEIKAILNSELIWTGVSAEYDIEEIYGRTIDVYEAEVLFKDRIELYISWVLFVDASDFKRRFADFNNLVNGNLSPEQMDKLFSVISKLKNSNYKKVTLIIRIYDEDYRSEIVEEITGYFKNGIYQFNVTEENLLCRIRIHDLNNVFKPDDVGSHINTEITDGFLRE